MPNDYFQFVDGETQSTDLVASYTNPSTTLISGLTDLQSGFDFADLYTLTVNAIDLNSKKISLNVQGATIFNPFDNVNLQNVIADGTTYNYSIISGVGVQFSDASLLTVGDLAYIQIGYTLYEGTITAGSSDDVNSTIKQIGLQNMWSTALSNCKARVVAKPRPVNITGTPIVEAYCAPTWANSDTVTHAITFTGYVPGSNQVCQIDNGADIEIVCDSTAANEILSGLFVVFNDALSISSSNTATIRISDGYRNIELAPDSNGLPGTWVSGSTPVTVTQTGEIDGVIQPLDVGFFWKRVNAGSSVLPVGNPREYTIIAQGDITS
jgi:hypothetical protein